MVFNLGGAVAVVIDVASGVTEMLLLQNINSNSSLTGQKIQHTHFICNSNNQLDNACENKLSYHFSKLLYKII